MSEAEVAVGVVWGVDDDDAVKGGLGTGEVGEDIEVAVLRVG